MYRCVLVKSYVFSFCIRVMVILLGVYEFRCCFRDFLLNVVLVLNVFFFLRNIENRYRVNIDNLLLSCKEQFIYIFIQLIGGLIYMLNMSILFNINKMCNVNEFNSFCGIKSFNDSCILQ